MKSCILYKKYYFVFLKKRYQKCAAEMEIRRVCIYLVKLDFIGGRGSSSQPLSSPLIYISCTGHCQPFGRRRDCGPFVLRRCGLLGWRLVGGAAGCRPCRRRLVRPNSSTAPALAPLSRYRAHPSDSRQPHPKAS